MKRIFEANDGTRFATAPECKQHEEQCLRDCLVGLSKEQVTNALNRSEPHIYIATAIERAGHKITEARRKSGHLRRRSKKSASLADVSKAMQGARK